VGQVFAHVEADEASASLFAQLPSPHHGLESDHVLACVAVGEAFGEDVPPRHLGRSELMFHPFGCIILLTWIHSCQRFVAAWRPLPAKLTGDLCRLSPSICLLLVLGERIAPTR